MKAKEFIPASKPRNFVAKNAPTSGAGRHQDSSKKKDQEQGKVKHKKDLVPMEGWSDAYVARRTGQPRTPYSVYIKGKKWKDFENDDHAEAVANKLKAKFKADGRDPETITIAPTDMSEAISKKDLVGRLQKDLPKVTDPKNKNAEPVAWTGPGKDDYGYTGYQGHGMPTDKAERARIRADKKKGMAESLPQTLRKVVPGYAKREIDKKMDDQKFGRTDVDKDANYYRYKKIQDKLKEQGVAEAMSQRNRAQGAIGHGLPWKSYDDLDQLAQDISDKILTITNIVKLNNMAHDSTIYNTLERYFKKYGYPDNVFNRVASIVFKRLDNEGRRMTTDPRIQEQGVAEGESALEKFRKSSAEREKKHDAAEKEMKARHARGEEDMKGSIDRLEKHVNNK